MQVSPNQPVTNPNVVSMDPENQAILHDLNDVSERGGNARGAMDESKLDESKQDTNQGEIGQEVQKNDQPLVGGNENDDDYGDEGY